MGLLHMDALVFGALPALDKHKILIAVVIGALLLAGLYALFGDVVIPTLTRRIQEMFNYAG